jgi:hypothetical protein
VSGPEAPCVLLAGADQYRLARYRAERPDVLIGGGEFGTWQALIPEPGENGETIVVRHTLGELLDKLDALLGDR